MKEPQIPLEICEQLWMGLLTEDEQIVEDHITGWIRDHVTTVGDLRFTVMFCAELAGSFTSRLLELNPAEEFMGMIASREPVDEHERIEFIVAQFLVAASNRDQEMVTSLVDAALHPEVHGTLSEAEQERHGGILVASILQTRAILMETLRIAKGGQL